MWKWIVGVCLLVVLVIAGTCYVGIKKFNSMRSGGDTVSVVIAGTPDRVFAALADGDSIAVWSGADSSSRLHHGLLAPGDTAFTVSGSTTVRSSQTFVVTSVVPGQLFATEIRGDRDGQVVMSRRDTVFARGDSTVVLSTIKSPMFDSMRNRTADSSQLAGKLLDMSNSAAIAAFRIGAEQGLHSLKAHIEGKPVPKE